MAYVVFLLLSLAALHLHIVVFIKIKKTLFISFLAVYFPPASLQLFQLFRGVLYSFLWSSKTVLISETAQ